MDPDTLEALTQAADDPPDQNIDEHVHLEGDPPCSGCGWKITVIPEGWTRDPHTREIRPKKRGGKRRIGIPSPRPDQPIQRGTDESPNSKAKGKRQVSTPRWQKGVIAAGMTKLYQRTGRIIKAMDRQIGIVVIESAADCGEAWDELARTNPNVRRFLMKLISGGAWGAIIMAHLPILLAIIMKDGIKKHIPFMKLIDSLVSDDDTDIGGLLSGINSDDMHQMMQMAMSQMGGMAARTVQNGSE